MTNGGGMVAACLKADDQQTIDMLSRCRLFALAESLGAIESLVGQPLVDEPWLAAGRGPSRARHPP